MEVVVRRLALVLYMLICTALAGVRMIGVWIGSRRWLSLVMMLLLLLILPLGIEVVPLLYGRFALTYEAAFLAQTSILRSPENARQILIATAFRNGFTDVLTQPEAFSIEQNYDDDGAMVCKIDIKIQQRISFSNSIGFPFRIHSEVVRLVDLNAEKPKDVADRVQ